MLHSNLKGAPGRKFGTIRYRCYSSLLGLDKCTLSLFISAFLNSILSHIILQKILSSFSRSKRKMEEKKNKQDGQKKSADLAMARSRDLVENC